MTNQLLFTPQVAWQLGVVAPGARAYFFEAGTTTPVVVFSDSNETIAHQSPLLADASGVFPAVFFSSGQNVKAVLEEADGASIATVDPVPKLTIGGNSAANVGFDPVEGNDAREVQSAIAQNTERLENLSLSDLDSVTAYFRTLALNINAVEFMADLGEAKATQGLAEAGADNATWMTPLTTAQSVVSKAGKYAQFQDQRPSGTAPGTPTAGARNTRVLNTTIQNNITGAALTANQISLPEGRYLISGYASERNAGRGRAIVWDATNDVALLLGISRDSDTSELASQFSVQGVVTLTETTLIELQTYHEKATSFGVPVSDGQLEVYANLIIQKLP